MIMLVTLAEAKEYLRVDYADEDATITALIQAGSRQVIDTLRLESEPAAADVTPAMKIATLFAVVYLFEHRDDAKMDELTRNLRYILSTERKAAF